MTFTEIHLKTNLKTFLKFFSNYLKPQILIKMKTCTKCNKSKALTEFSKESRGRDGLNTRCKVCKKAYCKKWYQNNLEKERARGRKYYENNPEKRRAYNRKRSKRPETKKRNNARQRERMKTDPVFKLKRTLRTRIWDALKGRYKSASTMKLLGCSIPHLKDHLEKQFLPGMTWENHGKWHIDHMMPCASFDLTDPEQQRQCCHYTNLQPMWGKENMSKQDKILYNRTWNGFRWINTI